MENKFHGENPENIRLKSEVNNELDFAKNIERYKSMEVPEVGEVKFRENQVNFSERIVKETGGVKGYIRKELQWKDLATLIPESTQEDYRDYLALLEKENQVDSFKEMENLRRNRSQKEKELSQKYSLGDVLNDSRIHNIYKSLTDGNIPDKTHIHMFNGVYSRFENAVEQFKNEKFLLQQISVSKDHNMHPPESADSGNMYVHNTKGEVKLLRKDTKIGKLNDLNDGVYFISSLKGGLSITEKGKPWYTEPGSIGPGAKEIFFGFSNHNKVFSDYISKTEELYENLKSKIDPDRQDWRYFQESLLNIKSPDYRHMYSTQDSSFTNHPRIPLVINHKAIPNLRWCHAAYASIPTDKGLNIIEMIT